jgi:DNA repair photolyase
MAQMSPKYKGPVRLLEDELKVNYGKGKNIFVEHMNDMFAEDVPTGWIVEILKHCFRYPENKYVFQSKNPAKARYFDLGTLDCIFGTTIESNREFNLSKAPKPRMRYLGMMEFKDAGIKRFVTIEPIMDFDVERMVGWIRDIQPEFVNIGADSKHSALPEPPKEKILELISGIRDAGIEIREKSNLDRILNAHETHSYRHCVGS